LGQLHICGLYVKFISRDILHSGHERTVKGRLLMLWLYAHRISETSTGDCSEMLCYQYRSSRVTAQQVCINVIHAASDMVFVVQWEIFM